MSLSQTLIQKELDNLKSGPLAPILQAVLDSIWTNAGSVKQENIAKMILNQPEQVTQTIQNALIAQLTTTATNNVNALLSTGSIPITTLQSYFP